MIDVVIPVHNRREITLTCLRDLAAQQDIDFRIVVVDDGSTDGTSAAIHQQFPNVTVLQGDGNLWWGGAVNVGIAHCLSQEQPPKHIVLLNDDIRLDSSFLKVLADCAERHPRALIGSLAVAENQRSHVLWCGTAATQSACLAGRVERSSLSGVVAAETLPGRALIIPRAVFEEVGLFDAEAFPHYFSDVDFSLRAKEAGFSLLCCCDTALALHAEQTAIGNAHRKVDWWTFMKTFGQKRSPNHLGTLWAYYQRHHSGIEFAGQVARIFLGDAARRLGLRHVGPKR